MHGSSQDIFPVLGLFPDIKRIQGPLPEIGKTLKPGPRKSEIGATCVGIQKHFHGG
jgi:hypothetical protein